MKSKSSKILALLLTIVMLISMMPLAASAATQPPTTEPPATTAPSAADPPLLAGARSATDITSAFKDPIFLAEVRSILGKDASDPVFDSEVADIQDLDVNYMDISDLAGIEYFTSLSSLFCAGNQLTELDMSNSPALYLLSLDCNQLTKLDVSNNPELSYLSLDDNQLTELDVSNNPKLVTLWCLHNELTELDVRNNPALEYLFCANNYMPDIAAVKTSHEIAIFEFYPQRTNVPNSVKLKSLAVSVGTLSPSFNPDVKTYSVTVGYDVTSIVITAEANVASSTITGSGIKMLAYDINEFSITVAAEDGTQNTYTITVTKSPDISPVFKDPIFLAAVRSRLGKDASDHILASEVAGIWHLDLSHMGISDLAGIEYFTSLSTLSCNANQLSELDVSSNLLLSYLYCSHNQLTELDVSHNSALRYLICDNNQLAELDVSNNPALIYLYCASNPLGKLDVSNNTALNTLICGYNQLTELDVSNNPMLTSLYCFDNQLTKLDVSYNTRLVQLYCSDNLLTELDVSNNPTLNTLDCCYNYMPDISAVKTSHVIPAFYFNPQYVLQSFSVTGVIRSYNPNNATTLVLTQGGVEKYRTTIGSAAGSGLTTQTFTFTGIAPGTYTLVVNKLGHTSFTVRNIVVGASNVDLTQDTRPDVRLMTLHCGDLNGDGMINDGDLTILWMVANYNKNAANAANPLSDLNGDGMINDGDLTILWMVANYNKGAVEIE